MNHQLKFRILRHLKHAGKADYYTQAEQIVEIVNSNAHIGRVSKAFFRWWWNKEGTNTDEGWEEFKKTHEYMDAIDGIE